MRAGPSVLTVGGLPRRAPTRQSPTPSLEGHLQGKAQAAQVPQSKWGARGCPRDTPHTTPGPWGHHPLPSVRRGPRGGQRAAPSRLGAQAQNRIRGAPQPQQQPALQSGAGGKGASPGGSTPQGRPGPAAGPQGDVGPRPADGAAATTGPAGVTSSCQAPGALGAAGRAEPRAGVLQGEDQQGSAGCEAGAAGPRVTGRGQLVAGRAETSLPPPSSP